LAVASFFFKSAIFASALEKYVSLEEALRPLRLPADEAALIWL
jgi:hypothetical protein